MQVHELQFHIIFHSQSVSVAQSSRLRSSLMSQWSLLCFVTDFSTVSRDCFCHLLNDCGHILQYMLTHSSTFTPQKLICFPSSFTVTGSVHLIFIPKLVCSLWFLHKVLFYTFLSYLGNRQNQKALLKIVMWVKVQVHSCLCFLLQYTEIVQFCRL